MYVKSYQVQLSKHRQRHDSLCLINKCIIKEFEKVGSNTVKYTTTFLYSNWLIFYFAVGIYNLGVEEFGL